MMYGRAEVETKQSSAAQCWKYLLYTMNFLFMLGGIAVVAGVLYLLLVKLIFVVDISNNMLTTVAAWMLIIGAAFMCLILPFIGCCGAYRESRCLLMVYVVIQVLIFLTFLIAASLCFSHREQVGEWMIGTMENTLRNFYGVDLENYENQKITEMWDKAQQEMYCCGVRDQSWNLYRQTKWFAEEPGDLDSNTKNMVPVSCCKRNLNNQEVYLQKCQLFQNGPPNRQSNSQPGGGTYNEALFYRGCYSALEDWIWDWSSWLVGIGLGFAIAAIVAIVFAVALYIALRN